MDSDVLAMHSILRGQVNAFSPITDQDWRLLVPFIEVKYLRKGDAFSREGKKASEIGLVVKGMLRQFYTRDGQEKTTYFFFENHFISSYVSCVTGRPSLVTIEALSSVTCLCFPYRAILDLYEQSMSWQRFGRVIAEYLVIGLEERMVSLLIETPEERYVNLLKGNKGKIVERIPQHYIANYLGITPVSMSRIRSRLSKK